MAPGHLRVAQWESGVEYRNAIQALPGQRRRANPSRGTHDGGSPYVSVRDGHSSFSTEQHDPPCERRTPRSDSGKRHHLRDRSDPTDDRLSHLGRPHRRRHGDPAHRRSTDAWLPSRKASRLLSDTARTGSVVPSKPGSYLGPFDRSHSQSDHDRWGSAGSGDRRRMGPRRFSFSRARGGAARCPEDAPARGNDRRRLDRDPLPRPRLGPTPRTEILAYTRQPVTDESAGLARSRPFHRVCAYQTPGPTHTHMPHWPLGTLTTALSIPKSIHQNHPPPYPPPCPSAPNDRPTPRSSPAPPGPPAGPNRTIPAQRPASCPERVPCESEVDCQPIATRNPPPPSPFETGASPTWLCGECAGTRSEAALLERQARGWNTSPSRVFSSGSVRFRRRKSVRLPLASATRGPATSGMRSIGSTIREV